MQLSGSRLQGNCLRSIFKGRPSRASVTPTYVVCSWKAEQDARGSRALRVAGFRLGRIFGLLRFRIWCGGSWFEFLNPFDAAVLGVVPFAPATNELTLRRPRGNAEDRGLYLSIVSGSLVGLKA